MPGDSKSRKSKSVKSIKPSMKSKLKTKSKSSRSRVNKKQLKRSFNNISYEKTFVKKTFKKAMPTYSIGRDTGAFESTISFASKEEFMDLVYNKISDGPQIVSLPVPPWRHAFLVDVQTKKKTNNDIGLGWRREQNSRYCENR